MEKQEFEKSLTDSREYFEVSSHDMDIQIAIFDDKLIIYETSLS